MKTKLSQFKPVIQYQYKMSVQQYLVYKNVEGDPLKCWFGTLPEANLQCISARSATNNDTTTYTERMAGHEESHTDDCTQTATLKHRTRMVTFVLVIMDVNILFIHNAPHAATIYMSTRLKISTFSLFSPPKHLILDQFPPLSTMALFTFASNLCYMAVQKQSAKTAVISPVLLHPSHRSDEGHYLLLSLLSLYVFTSCLVNTPDS